MRHVVFTVGSERYALPLGVVREVVTPGTFSRVPRAPHAVRGIMNLRGRVVTIVDLACIFELPVTVGGMVVLLDRGRRDLGLLVSRVHGIHVIETGQLVPAPGAALASVRGVAHSAEGALTVLDAEGLDQQVVALFDEPWG